MTKAAETAEPIKTAKPAKATETAETAETAEGGEDAAEQTEAAESAKPTEGAESAEMEIFMTFSDIFKNSFIESFSNFGDVGMRRVLITLGVCSVLALYIFLVYRVVTRKTFYSKSFNISLAGVSVITAAIILTIQSNIILSLGMVGALSIVRFRTAIKDPMDLMFLFWSISIGIICGAAMYEIAVILSLILTVGILILEKIPFAKASMILVVNASREASEAEISGAVKSCSRYMKVKSRNVTKESMDMTFEIRTTEDKNLVDAVSGINGVESVSLLSHDGEVTF